MASKSILEQVRNIEQMELNLAVFNAKRTLAPTDKQLQVKKIGSSTLLIEPSGPGSIYHNRVKGFGVNDLDRLDEILDEYAVHHIVPSFDMTPDRLDEQTAKALSDKGFACTEQLAFLQAEPYLDDGLQNPNITIVKVTEHNVDRLMETISLSNGGIAQDILDRKKAYFYEPHFINYLAYIDDEIAGLGSLFIHDNEAYVANDFTFPPFRGRGCQTALIAHRIREARGLGMAALYTDVEFGSASHNNMLRMGFQTVFINSFWVKK